MIARAHNMARDSYLGEFEIRLNLALNYPSYSVNENSKFFFLVKEYVENYYNKFDVVEDIRYYLPLFGVNESHALRMFVRDKLDIEETNYLENDDAPPSINLIRWRIVHFKLNKVLGAFDHLENQAKLELVNTIMQTYLFARGMFKSLEFNDRVNLDDIIIVAAELLYEVKIWDWSVLNPVNFMLLSMLEYAMKRSGLSSDERNTILNSIKDPKLLKRFDNTSKTLRVMLMRIEAKLGLSTKFTAVGKNLKYEDSLNKEKFGALKYSHYQAYGSERELGETCDYYDKYYNDEIIKNKKTLVDGFKYKNFENLNELIEKTELLESSFLKRVVVVSKMHLDVLRNAS
jgi:hypothetical protein